MKLFIATLFISISVATSLNQETLDPDFHSTFPLGRLDEDGAYNPNTTVCYDVVGCFSNLPPYNNAGLFLPVSPDVIQTAFLLYTPANLNTADEITYNDQASIRQSHFDKNLRIIILIHGFTNDRTSPWLYDYKDAFMETDPSNVIIVDWGLGAQMPFYNNATANTRLVGKQTCLLIKDLLNVYFDSDWRKIHIYCIGHSLGAHTCGYASNLCATEFDRITGLDPAGPLYEGQDSRVRLDPGDAIFVDAIHTNAGKSYNGALGIIQPVGHVDFYVNGGGQQTGCPSLFGAIFGGDAANAAACNHNRVRPIFHESILSHCPYTAFKCDSYENFEKGNCFSCENNGCSSMGYYAEQYKGRGMMYLKTTGVFPFCGYNYFIEIQVNSASKQSAGNIILSPDHTNSSLDFAIFGDLPSTFTDVKGGNFIRQVIASERDLGQMNQIKLTFNKKPKTFLFTDKNSPIILVDSIKLPIRTSMKVTTTVEPI